MQRRTVAAVVLAGIWLAGGLGSRLMSEGAARPKAGEAVGIRRIPMRPPLKVVSEACPVIASHPEVGCDTLVTAGD